jgi:hypothetical protein
MSEDLSLYCVIIRMNSLHSYIYSSIINISEYIG